MTRVARAVRQQKTEVVQPRSNPLDGRRHIPTPRSFSDRSEKVSAPDPDEGMSRAARVLARERRVRDGARSLTAEQAANLLEQRRRLYEESRRRQDEILGDAVQQRADEAKLVRANRLASTALSQLNGKLIRTAIDVAGTFDATTLATLPIRDRLRYLRDVAAIVKQTAESSKLAVQMERLLLGEPTHILKVDGAADTHDPPRDMTPDEAEQWLAIATRTLKRRAARATVVDADTFSDRSENEPDTVEDLDAHIDDDVGF